jgi:alkanesulfonate monooxygenase SsuD/methylene tetrahydromethanopterin reductase-like flavin-dependent oxidoreductase (luciferase family)
MKYGLELQMFGKHGDPKTVGDLAHLAEQSGWDGVFLEDYVYFEDENGTPLEVFDPWIELAVIASKTETVRIGTELTPLARRRPWKVAREALTLDHLSNGRMTLTAGLGGFGDKMNDKGFTHFGEVLEAKERAKILDEGLEIIDGLWKGKPFSYQGKYHKIKEVTFLPRPVQKPRIPIWICGFYPRAGPLQRAARWDGFCPAGTEKLQKDGERVRMTLSDIVSMKEHINKLRVQKDAPFDIVLGGMRRDKDPEKEREFRKQYLDAHPSWWMEYVPQSYGGVKVARSIIETGPIRVD